MQEQSIGNLDKQKKGGPESGTKGERKRLGKREAVHDNKDGHVIKSGDRSGDGPCDIRSCD